ncbi:hypothetical protein ID866_9411, partial [Astraeus odoratus]
MAAYPSARKHRLSAYDQRHAHSIPAPLGMSYSDGRAHTDPDSDPEFNSGAFVYESKTRTKKRRVPPLSVRPVCLSAVFFGARAGVSSGRHGNGEPAAGVLRSVSCGAGDDLDLHSASDDDEGEGDVEPVDDPDDEEDGGDAYEGEEEPVVSKTLMMFANRRGEGAVLETRGAQGDAAAADSETEPESDAEPAPEPVPNTEKRKSPSLPSASPPAKRVKAAPPDGDDICALMRLGSAHGGVDVLADDSETESESEPEPARVPVGDVVHAAHFLVRPARESDSETESEDEADLVANPAYSPRPGFPLGPGQAHLGPLVLDRAKGVMVPASINTYLREYQRDGVRFFWGLYNEGRGGLLGDDMGLVISFLSAIMKKHGDDRDVDRRRNHVSELQDGPEWTQKRTLPPANALWPTCLVIAPSSVVQNWEREFRTWGYFEVGLYVGTPDQREGVLTDFKMGRLDVVITSFDLARRDIALLDDLAWSAVIVDEVHRVKNPRSKMTEAYHRFACQRRFGLTGTAIQNSYHELWTILDWTNPGRLG